MNICTMTHKKSSIASPLWFQLYLSLQIGITFNQTSPQDSSKSSEFHSLLDGEYNEKESAASFKEALQDWRKGIKDAENKIPSGLSL